LDKLHKKDLRRSVRQARRQLSEQQQQQHAQGLTEQLIHHEVFRNSQHIAVYLAHDGEIDPQALVQAAWDQGKAVYLPVINRDQPLSFRRYQSDTQFQQNELGIIEPDGSSESIEPDRLDLVLAPLVAFDGEGNRMGMGKGYYDRTFSFLNKAFLNTGAASPLLIGLAHNLQQVEYLQPESWDVKLNAIATEDRLQWFD